MPSFEYRPDLPYSELLVPSVDTTRYGALLDCLLAVDRSVLLTGPAGAGKSALVRRCLQNQQVGAAGSLRNVVVHQWAGHSRTFKVHADAVRVPQATLSRLCK